MDSNTTIASTYMQDRRSGEKLYFVKSNNLKTTSINTQFHVPKEYVDYTQGFVIEMDVYYDPATHDETKYNWVCGRGNNTGLHSGMCMPGTFYSAGFLGGWRNLGAYSTISKTGLTADWYTMKLTVTTTTVTLSLTNLRTGTVLTGNTATVGTVNNGDAFSLTFLSYGIEGYTGAYGSVGLNVSNIRITRAGVCLLDVPCSEGGGTKVTDVCNSTQYQMAFVTEASLWGQNSVYTHHNILYGFTLQTKSGALSIRVPNTKTMAEVVVTPPTGYTRISNTIAGRFHNGAENKYKLADRATSDPLYLADVDSVFFTSGTGVAKEFDITTLSVADMIDRGYFYINYYAPQKNFRLYSVDNTLAQDTRIIKNVGLGARISYNPDGTVKYDANDHTVLI